MPTLLERPSYPDQRENIAGRAENNQHYSHVRRRVPHWFPGCASELWYVSYHRCPIRSSADAQLQGLVSIRLFHEFPLRADLFSGQREYYWATISVRDGGPEEWLISPQVPLRGNALAIDRPSGKFRRSSFLWPAIGSHEIPP